MILVARPNFKKDGALAGATAVLMDAPAPSDSSWKDTLEALDTPLVVCDSHFQVVWHNAAFNHVLPPHRTTVEQTGFRGITPQSWEGAKLHSLAPELHGEGQSVRVMLQGLTLECKVSHGPEAHTHTITLQDISTQVRIEKERYLFEKLVENSGTPLMFADTNRVIRYVNQSAIEEFKREASKFRALYPHFDPNSLVGTCIDIFHSNPSHQARMFQDSSIWPITHNTSSTFTSIKEGIHELGALITEISDASGQQANGIQELMSNLHQIDTVTQYNTADAEEMAGASIQLASQADRLRHMLSQFTLDIPEPQVPEQLTPEMMQALQAMIAKQPDLLDSLRGRPARSAATDPASLDGQQASQHIERAQRSASSSDISLLNDQDFGAF